MTDAINIDTLRVDYPITSFFANSTLTYNAYTTPSLLPLFTRESSQRRLNGINLFRSIPTRSGRHNNDIILFYSFTPAFFTTFQRFMSIYKRYQLNYVTCKLILGDNVTTSIDCSYFLDLNGIYFEPNFTPSILSQTESYTNIFLHHSTPTFSTSFVPKYGINYLDLTATPPKITHKRWYTPSLIDTTTTSNEHIHYHGLLLFLHNINPSMLRTDRTARNNILSDLFTMHCTMSCTFAELKV